MSTGLKANPDGSAAIQVGGTDVITLTSGGAATFVTSPTTVQAGTAAAPSITTSGDTNTGIFFPAADTIAFAEGGVEVGRFDSSANFQFNSGYGSVATAYGCRAWVNFNGTGTVAIRASGNVTSITDNGTGDYTVNFTTAMPDANYATKITTNRSSGNTTLVNISRIADELSAPTVSSVRIAQGVPDASRVLQREDASFIMVSIFR